MQAATRHQSVDMRIADVLKAPAPPDCFIVLLEERGGERQLLRVDGGVLDRAMAEEPDVPVPPLPAPGGQGAPGARAIVQELLGG
jgi:hypothetical protein